MNNMMINKSPKYTINQSIESTLINDNQHSAVMSVMKMAFPFSFDFSFHTLFVIPPWTVIAAYPFRFFAFLKYATTNTAPVFINLVSWVTHVFRLTTISFLNSAPLFGMVFNINIDHFNYQRIRASAMSMICDI